MQWSRRTYLTILFGATAWCGMLLVAPIAASSGSPALAGVFYDFFRPICHQIDVRSLHLFGLPLAVCSRCSSIYVGFLAGTLAYPLIRDLRRPVMPGRAFLALMLLPMLLDVGAGMLGVDDPGNAGRMVTGGWFGLLIPFLIIPGAIEGVAQLSVHRSPPSIQPEKGPTDA
jgi:uncharacterized membrane protein